MRLMAYLSGYVLKSEQKEKLVYLENEQLYVRFFDVNL